MLINKSDYLDQYDKELKAEPYGKSKQEKIDALSEMALGADGVQIGTRFALTDESSAHFTFKDRCLRLNEGDTQLTLKQLSPVRLVKNDFFKQVEEAESRGATTDELRTLLGKGRAKKGIFEGDLFEVFDEEAHKIKDVKWLAQGTIYPDCIESLSITGTVIKSHHNVGGLPEKMNLKLCEPLRLLFKDEVRHVGRELGMPEHLITRHPFPGPGLAVRILGDITPEKVRILQDADDIYIQGLRDWKVKDSDGNETSLYHQVWQAGVILLPVQSVGVMGDERTYERAVALRAVTSTDAMTADWAHLPYEFMAKVSNDIINKVKGVNRVCYDISSKPPATIEWE